MQNLRNEYFKKKYYEKLEYEAQKSEEDPMLVFMPPIYSSFMMTNILERCFP